MLAVCGVYSVAAVGVVDGGGCGGSVVVGVWRMGAAQAQGPRSTPPLWRQAGTHSRVQKDISHCGDCAAGWQRFGVRAGVAWADRGWKEGVWCCEVRRLSGAGHGATGRAKGQMTDTHAALGGAKFLLCARRLQSPQTVDTGPMGVAHDRQRVPVCATFAGAAHWWGQCSPQVSVFGL